MFLTLYLLSPFIVRFSLVDHVNSPAFSLSTPHSMNLEQPETSRLCFAKTLKSPPPLPLSLVTCALSLHTPSDLESSKLRTAIENMHVLVLSLSCSFSLSTPPPPSQQAIPVAKAGEFHRLAILVAKAGEFRGLVSYRLEGRCDALSPFLTHPPPPLPPSPQLQAVICLVSNPKDQPSMADVAKWLTSWVGHHKPSA
ncbi:unnamed protein product [Closterium sp. NIES-65]|nr:unnamed protein product [Closterium sp. NIES-65]